MQIEVMASALSGSPSLMSPESGLIPPLAGWAAEEGLCLAGSSALQPRSIWAPICPRILAGLLHLGEGKHSRLAPPSPGAGERLRGSVCTTSGCMMGVETRWDVLASELPHTRRTLFARWEETGRRCSPWLSLPDPGLHICAGVDLSEQMTLLFLWCLSGVFSYVNI